MSKRPKSQKERILAFIRRRPKSGATRRELVDHLDILHQSVGPRVKELVAAGYVAGAGQQRDGCEILLPVVSDHG